jgi:hypothetical protein
MNQNAPAPHPDPAPDTTILHLGQFVPQTSLASAITTSDESVTALIAKAAAETCQEKLVVVPKNAGPVGAESMLGAVSYCYMKGVYSSSDIERKMYGDPAFRASCGNEIPRPEDIRRFRRLNRDAIQATLEKVFRRTRKKIATLWWPDNPFRRAASPGAPLPQLPTPAPREETQVFVRREATDRLDKATFIDGMSF